MYDDLVTIANGNRRIDSAIMSKWTKLIDEQMLFGGQMEEMKPVSGPTKVTQFTYLFAVYGKCYTPGVKNYGPFNFESDEEAQEYADHYLQHFDISQVLSFKIQSLTEREVATKTKSFTPKQIDTKK